MQNSFLNIMSSHAFYSHIQHLLSKLIIIGDWISLSKTIIDNNLRIDYKCT